MKMPCISHNPQCHRNNNLKRLNKIVKIQLLASKMIAIVAHHQVALMMMKGYPMGKARRREDDMTLTRKKAMKAMNRSRLLPKTNNRRLLGLQELILIKMVILVSQTLTMTSLLKKLVSS